MHLSLVSLRILSAVVVTSLPDSSRWKKCARRSKSWISMPRSGRSYESFRVSKAVRHQHVELGATSMLLCVPVHHNSISLAKRPYLWWTYIHYFTFRRRKDSHVLTVPGSMRIGDCQGKLKRLIITCIITTCGDGASSRMNRAGGTCEACLAFCLCKWQLKVRLQCFHLGLSSLLLGLSRPLSGRLESETITTCLPLARQPLRSFAIYDLLFQAATN